MPANNQFDPIPHLVNMIIIRCGEKLRRARGQEEERDLTKLYQETATELGLAQIQTATIPRKGDPVESTRGPDGSQTNPLVSNKPVTSRKCPKCKGTTFEVFGVRPSAEESEGGKYLSIFECTACHYSEKSSKPMIEWMRMLSTGLPPARECPSCHKTTSFLRKLCGGCTDSEGGKYKVRFYCVECGHDEKSTKPLVAWLNELGEDYGLQSIKSLGVSTVTDEKLK